MGCGGTEHSTLNFRKAARFGPSSIFHPPSSLCGSLSRRPEQDRHDVHFDLVAGDGRRTHRQGVLQHQPRAVLSQHAQFAVVRCRDDDAAAGFELAQ